MYKASIELIEILEKNGLKDKSYLGRADYGKCYALKGEKYSPQAHKKEFGLGKGTSKLCVFFDYSNIVVIEGGAYITSQYITLDESKLRSIIAYFKLSYARRRTMRTHCHDKIENAGQYLATKKQRGLNIPPFDEQFEKIYNEVIL